MSAADSSKLWDLRCLVREKMIDYLQKNYPHCLPKQRLSELQNAPWEQINEHQPEQFQQAPPQPHG